MMDARLQSDLDSNFARWRDDYEAGEKEALIAVLWLAGAMRSPAPEWASHALFQGLSAWRNGEYRTIDEALGVQRPKGWRKPPYEHRFASLAWQKGSEMVRAGRPRDETFKEELAEHCSSGGASIGKTVAYEMFLQWERELDRLALDRLAKAKRKVKPRKD